MRRIEGGRFARARIVNLADDASLRLNSALNRTKQLTRRACETDAWRREIRSRDRIMLFTESAGRCYTPDYDHGRFYPGVHPEIIIKSNIRKEARLFLLQTAISIPPRRLSPLLYESTIVPSEYLRVGSHSHSHSRGCLVPDFQHQDRSIRSPQFAVIGQQREREKRETRFAA